MNHQTEGTPRRRPATAPSNPGPVKGRAGGREKPAQVGPVIVLPAMPPLSDRELAQEQEILRLLQGAAVQARMRNLENAILLAQQAARGVGPLVDHFCELGRRYGDLLDAPPKPALLAIKGGAA